MMTPNRKKELEAEGWNLEEKTLEHFVAAEVSEENYLKCKQRVETDAKKRYVYLSKFAGRLKADWSKRLNGDRICTISIDFGEATN